MPEYAVFFIPAFYSEIPLPQNRLYLFQVIKSDRNSHPDGVAGNITPTVSVFTTRKINKAANFNI